MRVRSVKVINVQIMGRMKVEFDSVRLFGVGIFGESTESSRFSFGTKIRKGDSRMMKSIPAVKREERAGFIRPSHVPSRSAMVESMKLVRNMAFTICLLLDFGCR